ncbi:MAG TPA: peptidylprolyl isomerase, partial [Acidimicrobiales bacterium]|nr:peptidylprolyl isomerase [Acidimicrobiales bacterium]
MPSDKRARQRAAREARTAALERQKRRRSTIRRVVTVAVLAGVAVGIYALVSGGGSPKAAKSTSTTTTSSTSTTLPPNAASTTTTVSLTGDTTSANCPTPFTATTPLKKPKFSAAPPMIIDPSKNYSATVTTDVGSFTIALDSKDAPKTVNNFVFLAENHFYDCVVYHRVIPQFMNQSGDPTGTGTGGPGYQFADENLPPNSGGYTTGEVAMANSGANTNGSQFFVLVAPYNPVQQGAPNNAYSLFGHVISGQSVVTQINNDGTQAGTPKKLH